MGLFRAHSHDVEFGFVDSCASVKSLATSVELIFGLIGIYLYIITDGACVVYRSFVHADRRIMHVRMRAQT